MRFLIQLCFKQPCSKQTWFKQTWFKQLRVVRARSILFILMLYGSLASCSLSPAHDWSFSRAGIKNLNDGHRGSDPQSGGRFSSESLAIELADWALLKNKEKPAEKRPAIGESLPINYIPEENDSEHRALSIQLVDTPVELVLHEVVHQAGLQLQLNQSLKGAVTLSVSNAQLSTVLSQVALQVPIYWRVDNNVLHVWGNDEFSQSYAVNYLNLDRSTYSRVGLATQVGTINATVEGGASGASNSSQTSLENSADHHFWASLETDLNGMVNTSNSDGQASFTINRDAGMVTLHAKPRLHESFRHYLKLLNDNAQRQVLIEATVVEVALSSNFNAGIDWQLLSDKTNGVNAAQILSGSPNVNSESVSRITAPNGLLSIVQKTGIGGITATLNLLQQFGDVRILSKPRIIALNNQSSVLKVVDNRVYFTVNVERQRSENKDEVITETEIHTVPVGLVMHVTPHIDKSGGVMLNVRPTLSRILGFVDDPNPELAVADVKNSVPEIQVREMESMLRVRSGDVAIIGGLMQEVEKTSDSQLPLISQVPLFGKLFQQNGQSRQQTELLIVLRPTVLLDTSPGSIGIPDS